MLKTYFDITPLETSHPNRLVRLPPILASTCAEDRNNQSIDSTHLNQPKLPHFPHLVPYYLQKFHCLK